MGKVLFALTLAYLIVARALHLQFLPAVPIGHPDVATSVPEPVAFLIALMPLLISVVLLAAALWVILADRYGDATQKWAFGTAGSVVGYWLNTGNA